jgi:alkanesulfonate monooxygenase SsuD/methylene tetrahydromethanopterin reductase-like flavin-dependent oxidoreductase (luciferase family)
MKFALFYEIPVPRPWNRESELNAYRNTLEQAVFGDEMGFHAFWTVEHHFLEEFSHCSNPEVLYGAVAARTQNMRLGYGVRLQPKPYNHPVRSAESAAVLDLVSGGRVDFGAGRSSTRLELEGFGVDPDETRGMWREALEHVVKCWTEEYTELDGKYWSMPRRRVQPKPIQDPHPPIFGATASDSGHQMMGDLGLGLCSFSVAAPPEDTKRRIDIYRAAVEKCTTPLGATVNNQAAAFTMVNCAATSQASRDRSEESFGWYVKNSISLITTVADWMEEKNRKLDDTYSYLEPINQAMKSEALDPISNWDYLTGSKAVLAGTPDEVVETAKAYEEAGVDLLLCLVNPFKIGHEDVMETIELMGKHVIPEFAG